MALKGWLSWTSIPVQLMMLLLLISPITNCCSCTTVDKKSLLLCYRGQEIVALVPLQASSSKDLLRSLISSDIVSANSLVDLSSSVFKVFHTRPSLFFEAILLPFEVPSPTFRFTI